MNQLCVWMCGGGRGGDQLVATEEIRTPKTTSNKSTCQTPKKTNQKNQRGVYERKHKAKDYNTISKLWTDDQKDLSGWRKQRSHHINSSLLWISSSMNECLANFSGSIFRWLIETTCGVHLCCWRIGTLDQQFLLHLPTQYLIATVGCVAPPSLPFPKREPAGQFRVCKTPGWLTAVVNN